MSSNRKVDSHESWDIKWSVQACRGLMPDWSLRVLEESEDCILARLPLHPCTSLGLWCAASRLRQPTHVTLAAIALLERYIYTRVSRALKECKMVSGDEEEFKSQWRRSRTLLAHEMPLNVLSCIQLASKAAGACKSTSKTNPTSSHSCPLLSAAHIRNYLLDAGLTYQLKEVTESEFQVFKTLGFRIPLWSQLDITDLLCELVQLPHEAREAARACTKLAMLRSRAVRRRTRASGALVMPAAGVLAASKLIGAGVGVQRVRDDLARITELHTRMLECVADVIVTIALE